MLKVIFAMFTPVLTALKTGSRAGYSISIPICFSIRWFEISFGTSLIMPCSFYLDASLSSALVEFPRNLDFQPVKTFEQPSASVKSSTLLSAFSETVV